jgi:hypothetical protein
MTPSLADLRDAERAVVFYDQPAPPGESAIALLPGSQPILISAAHSVRHWRNGEWKQEEEYTAAFGYLLHRETGAYFIYGRYPLNPDPHDDGDDGPYKLALDDLFRTTPIRMVLDLHGARGDRDFAIALGTMRGASFAGHEASMLAAFERQGFKVDPDTSLDRLVSNPPRYTGGVRQLTVTRYAWQRYHIPAVQIEMSAWVRIVERLENASSYRNGTAPHFRGDGPRILRTYQALRTFIADTLEAIKDQP